MIETAPGQKALLSIGGCELPTTANNSQSANTLRLFCLCPMPALRKYCTIRTSTPPHGLAVKNYYLPIGGAECLIQSRPRDNQRPCRDCGVRCLESCRAHWLPAARTFCFDSRVFKLDLQNAAPKMV